MTKVARKKQKKEIRLAQPLFYAKEGRKYSDELTSKEMLKKYPKKVALKEKAIVTASMKRAEQKKTKRLAPHSKRASPSDKLPRTSTPHHVHEENERWIKTVTVQNVDKARRLTKKMLKKK